MNFSPDEQRQLPTAEAVKKYQQKYQQRCSVTPMLTSVSSTLLSSASTTTLTRGTRGKRRGPRHPGVVLLKPEPARRIGWRARYVDPDTEQTVKVALDTTLTTTELRSAWAVRKSEELKRRRFELANGATRASRLALSEVIERYFRAHLHLRKETLRGYRLASDKLISWAGKNGVRTADELTRAKLIGFRESLLLEPRRDALKKGTRGQRNDSDARRAPVSVNRDQRSIGTVLRYLIDLDLFTRLSFDDLRRALKRLPVVHERLAFLRHAELAQVITAAAAHDADAFKLTRDEKAGQRTPGSTKRFDAITPFLYFMLLTGMRLNEGVTLRWEDVDLEAGEIHLRGANVKTKQARTIDLSVSAALAVMLASTRPAEGRGSVFSITRDEAVAAGKRLRLFGAPRFTWQSLRRTCGTYLTNAPGIFGAASAYRSAKQLGHSVAVAEKHYVGIVKVVKDATTLEAAMGLPL